MFFFFFFTTQKQRVHTMEVYLKKLHYAAAVARVKRSRNHVVQNIKLFPRERESFYASRVLRAHRDALWLFANVLRFKALLFWILRKLIFLSSILENLITLRLCRRPTATDCFYRNEIGKSCFLIVLTWDWFKVGRWNFSVFKLSVNHENRQLCLYLQKSIQNPPSHDWKKKKKTMFKTVHCKTR